MILCQIRSICAFLGKNLMLPFVDTYIYSWKGNRLETITKMNSISYYILTILCWMLCNVASQNATPEYADCGSEDLLIHSFNIYPGIIHYPGTFNLDMSYTLKRQISEYHFNEIGILNTSSSTCRRFSIVHQSNTYSRWIISPCKLFHTRWISYWFM